MEVQMEDLLEVMGQLELEINDLVLSVSKEQNRITRLEGTLALVKKVARKQAKE